MLKLQPNPTFQASVTIHDPGGDDQVITVTFRRKGKADLKAYIEACQERDDLDTLADVVDGWNGVDAEFSREALADLLDAYPSAAVAILEKYVNEHARAAVKN